MNKRSINDRDEFYKKYIIENLSIQEMASYYKCSVTTVKNYAKEFGITKSKKLTQEKIKQTCLKRYGVENAVQSPEVKEKIKQTCLAKYGVDNPWKSNKVKSKSTQTLIERYGVENISQLKETQEKIKKTSLERYGVDHFLKSKDIQEKRKNTNLEKYGVENTYQSEELKEKIKETNLERYGVENVSQSDIIRDKVKQTCLDRYGVEYNLQAPEIRKRIEQTCLDRYGVNSPSKAKEVKEKIKETNLERYGVEWYCETEDAREANKPYKISKINRLFSQELLDNGIDNLLEYKNFDIKITNKDIVLEINPSYTHNSTFCSTFNKFSSRPKSSTYHQEKTLLAAENNLQCIHIFDWDDTDKIINMLKPKTKIYARKCDIKEVDIKEANEFLNTYHLQNTCRGQVVRLGLYYNSELIEIMTFGKPRYNKKYEYELLRLCTKAEYSVIGGSERLFKYFLDNFKPKSIVSYCDMSKFTGDVYIKLGFSQSGKISRPSKHWYNMKTCQHITDNLLRQRGFDQIFNENYGKGTSNEELMIEHGFVEIYDCGQNTYIWNEEN